MSLRLDRQPARDAREAQNESRLLERHAQGDAAAFSELVARYRAPVYGYLVRTGVPPDVRDDLFQEAFMRIHAHAQDFDSSRDLRPWIFTVVANTVRSHYRAHARHSSVLVEASDLDPPAEEASGHDWVEAGETADRLERALARLPRSQREALLLVCVEQLSQKQASEALDIPLNTLKTHLRRGRLALARALARPEPREVPS